MVVGVTTSVVIVVAASRFEKLGRCEPLTKVYLDGWMDSGSGDGGCGDDGAIGGES